MDRAGSALNNRRNKRKDMTSRIKKSRAIKRTVDFHTIKQLARKINKTVISEFVISRHLNKISYEYKDLYIRER